MCIYICKCPIFHFIWVCPINTEQLLNPFYLSILLFKKLVNGHPKCISIYYDSSSYRCCSLPIIVIFCTSHETQVIIMNMGLWSDRYRSSCTKVSGVHTFEYVCYDRWWFSRTYANCMNLHTPLPCNCRKGK